MMVWFIFLAWTIMSMLVGVGIGRWIHTYQSDDVSHNLDVLIKDVLNDSNKNRIEQLIKYHNNRIKAGADPKSSYDRLVNELNELKDNQDEDGDDN